MKEIRFLDVSGLDTFDLETKPALFGFSCDETDGPVVVTFAPDLVGKRIELDALRRILDEAERTILRRRQEWQASEPW